MLTREPEMNWITNLPIKLRLTVLVGLLALVSISIGLLGISGMRDADQGMDEIFHGNLHHTELLGLISEHNQELRTLLLLSLQHDPKNEFSKMHNHPLSLHLDLIRKDMEKIDEAWAEYQKLRIPKELVSYVDTFSKQKTIIFNKGYLPAIATLEGGDFHGANLLLLNTINPAFSKMLDAIDPMIAYESKMADEGFQITDSNYHRMISVVTTVIVVGVSLGVLLAYVIISGLTKGVLQIEEAAKRLAEGDLNARIEYTAKDEIGIISTTLNGMAENFHTMVISVKDAIARLASAAEETSVITTQTTGGIKQQQTEIAQVATAINQMSATVQEVARNAVEAASAAQQADQTFNEGKLVVDRVIGAIGDLSNEVEKASGVIKQLETESNNIGSVLDVIKSIAEQTNLLALNAAIEAARAGEQGRGFAVVADEVRTLAGRTQSSTQEIEEMISKLQAGTSNAVKVMDQGMSMSRVGVDQAALAGEALQTINTAVEHISVMNSQIASAAEEQSSVTEEINRSIISINQVADQTSSGAQQTAAASDDLAKLTEQLKGLVDHFKV
jgi:methyl-accepting chemotaxis protein